jgi:hypothetical protein
MMCMYYQLFDRLMKACDRLDPRRAALIGIWWGRWADRQRW